MSGDVIKEFLVGLGFKIDDAGQKKFTAGIGMATKAAMSLATAAAAMAAATVAAVVKMSERYEQLYYLSQRVGSSASNIEAYSYAFQQLGGSADGAKKAIEGVSNFMKFNPGGERFLQGLGIRTREANGELRDTTEVVMDLARSFKDMPLPKANVIAGMLGIDPQTLQVMTRDTDAFFADYKRKLDETGVNQEEAAKASAHLMQVWRDLLATLALLADKFLIWLIPAVEKTGLVIDDLWAKFMVWKDGSGSIVSSKWAPELQEAGKALMSLIGALIELLTVLGRLVAFIWKYTGPAIIELASGALKLLTNTLNVLADIIRMIAALLRGDWSEAWKQAKKVASDSLTGLVDLAMSLVKSVQKVWYAITHRGAAMPEAGAAAPAAAGGGSTAPAANDNASPVDASSAAGRVISYFVGKGWSREQASGIAANLKQESGFRTGAVGDGGKAYGMAQWHPDRQAAFKRWAGKDIRNSSFEEQLGFIHYEMTQGGERRAGDRLRAARTAYDSGAAVSRFYERPAKTFEEMANRGREADLMFKNSSLGGGRGGVTMNQTTAINVQGGDPVTTANAVAAAQDRVNSNVVRNLKSAAQ